MIFRPKLTWIFYFWLIMLGFWIYAVLEFGSRQSWLAAVMIFVSLLNLATHYFRSWEIRNNELVWSTTGFQHRTPLYAILSVKSVSKTLGRKRSLLVEYEAGKVEEFLFLRGNTTRRFLTIEPANRRAFLDALRPLIPQAEFEVDDQPPSK
jgi:hypothetical protein